MKRLMIYDYSIEGSVYSWPVTVSISKNESTQSWKLYFRYTDPEARSTERFEAADINKIHAVLDEHYISISDFADEAADVASILTDPRDKATISELAASLRELERSRTADH